MNISLGKQHKSIRQGEAIQITVIREHLTEEVARNEAANEENLFQKRSCFVTRNASRGYESS